MGVGWGWGGGVECINSRVTGRRVKIGKSVIGGSGDVKWTRLKECS